MFTIPEGEAMLTFRQFLKQKKLYNLDGTKDEYTSVYNKDFSVIDKDLDYDAEIKDGYVCKVSKINSEDDLDPYELKDSGGSDALRGVEGVGHWNDTDDTDDIDDTDGIDEDEGGSGACAVAPSVSAGAGEGPGIPVAPSVSSGTTASIGGTTSADIAGVPFGLTKNPEKHNEYGNDIISRMDAYI
jgi:hypothetical protein